jgi:hypothetical protein
MPISGVQFSEMNLDEYPSIPEGTSIVWEYSTDGGTTWDAIVIAEEENLPNIAADVLVRALFSGSEVNDSPALNFKDVNLIGYLNNTDGAYITRENELTQGVESTKGLYADEYPQRHFIELVCLKRRWFNVGVHGHRFDTRDRPGMDGIHVHTDLHRSYRNQGAVQGRDERQQLGLSADTHPRGNLELKGRL